MADTITFEIDAKTASELEAVLQEFIKKTEGLAERMKADDEKHRLWEARMDALGRQTDERLALLKQKLNIP